MNRQRAHFERVRRDQTIVTKFITQQARQNRTREGCGQSGFAVNCRKGHMRRHDSCNIGLDSGSEGEEFDTIESGAIVWNTW